MKIIPKFVVIFLALLAGSFAADCDYRGHKFNRGETYSPPGKCIQMTCGGVGQMSGMTCPPAYIPSHCPPGALSKPYPQCCPGYGCKF